MKFKVGEKAVLFRDETYTFVVVDSVAEEAVNVQYYGTIRSFHRGSEAYTDENGHRLVPAEGFVIPGIEKPVIKGMI